MSYFFQTYFRNVVIGTEGNNYVYDYIVNTIEGSGIDTLNEVSLANKSGNPYKKI